MPRVNFRRLSLSKKYGFIHFNESPLKMMRNAYCFTLQIFLFLIYLNFSPDFFGHAEKRLNKRATLYFKIYDVTNWKSK